MKLTQFLTDMLSSNSVSHVSSKRVAGIIGWLVTIGIEIYCTVKNVQAPDIADTVVYFSSGLLGLDSVVGIWKGKKQDKSDREEPQ